jgi:hypothetical protein
MRKDGTAREKIDQESPRDGSFGGTLYCFGDKTHIWVMAIDNRVTTSEKLIRNIDKGALVMRSYTRFMMTCAV